MRQTTFLMRLISYAHSEQVFPEKASAKPVSPVRDKPQSPHSPPPPPIQQQLQDTQGSLVVPMEQDSAASPAPSTVQACNKYLLLLALVDRLQTMKPSSGFAVQLADLTHKKDEAWITEFKKLLRCVVKLSNNSHCPSDNKTVIKNTLKILKDHDEDAVPLSEFMEFFDYIGKASFYFFILNCILGVLETVMNESDPSCEKFVAQYFK